MFELLTLFLTGGGRPQWGLFLKACLVRLPMLVSRSMRWKWRGNAGTTNLPSSSRPHLIPDLVELSLVLLVVCLLLSACSHSASSPVSPPSTRQFHSSAQQILQEKGGENFYSDSSVFRQSKPLWSLQRDILPSSKQQSCCR